MCGWVSNLCGWINLPHLIGIGFEYLVETCPVPEPLPTLHNNQCIHISYFIPDFPHKSILVAFKDVAFISRHLITIFQRSVFFLVPLVYLRLDGTNYIKDESRKSLSMQYLV